MERYAHAHDILTLHKGDAPHPAPLPRVGEGGCPPPWMGAGQGQTSQGSQTCEVSLEGEGVHLDTAVGRVSLASLVYSTFLGRGSNDWGYGIVLAGPAADGEGAVRRAKE